eukprot:6431141-Pyramimonas_sp.AAC.1
MPHHSWRRGMAEIGAQTLQARLDGLRTAAAQVVPGEALLAFDAPPLVILLVVDPRGLRLPGGLL